MAKKPRARRKPKDKFGDDSPRPESDNDLTVLCDLLQERGITRVILSYQGGGGDRIANDLVCEPDSAEDLPQWVLPRLEEVLESYCPEDCEDDLGGYGSITICPFDGTGTLDHNRYIETEKEIARTWNLPDRLRRRLIAADVKTVTIEFDGQGDEGAFQSFEFEPADSADSTLEDELEEVLAEQIPFDWVNNEGGHGTLTVTLPAGTVDMEGYARSTEESESTVTCWRWRK